ncbi:MAG TPA: adenylate kinase [Nitrososphaerales archaeon]|nr:adenylate kinase [Nitrososphaerales archaeon]
MKVRMVVVGIPGVGKTTVVDRVHSLVAGSKLVTFGTVMLEEGIRLGWIKHRDELRSLPVEKQKQLQTIAGTAIANTEERVLIVDTHLFIRTKEGFWPGLPFEVVRALSPTHLVLIEARSREVLERRKKDSTRYRDVMSEDEVQDELDLARSFLTVSSTLTGAPMLIIRNETDRSEEVAERLAATISEVSR